MPSWNVNDQKVPQERLALVSYASVVFVVLLLVGFWKLQVVQSGHFADLAERNRVRSIPIIAPRGAMLDREGRVLVDSYPSFSILLLRDDMKAIEKSIPQIVDGLGISRARYSANPGRIEKRAEIPARCNQAGCQPRGHRLRRIAPRRYSRPRTVDGPAPPLSAR